MKKTMKLTLSAICSTLVLAACGGGGGGGTNTNPTMTNQVSIALQSATQSLGTNTAGARLVKMSPSEQLQLTASASGTGTKVDAQKWSITQINGSSAGDQAPKLTDADCAGATKTSGSSAQGSSFVTVGTSVCTTILSVSSITPSATYLVQNVASSTASNASDSFYLEVAPSAAVSPTGFKVNTPTLPQLMSNKTTVSISATTSVNPGFTAENVTYSWKQTTGPSVVLAAANTATAAFYAETAGTYGFEVSASATINGKSETQTANQVLIVQDPSSAVYFTVSAGDIQATTAGSRVTLNGAVGGNTDASKLTYSWTQVSGPANVTLSNAETLTPQFLSTTGGTYVFRLTATANGSQKSAETVVSIESVSTSGTTPVFAVSAGDAQVLKVNVAGKLTGVLASGTPAPTNVAYSWTQVSGPAVTVANATSLVASFVPTAVGTYEFRITATAAGVSKTSNTTVLVTP